MKKWKDAASRLLADIKEYAPAGVVFLVYYGIVHLRRAAFCPLLNLTGIPCAGCGLTRAFLYLVQGKFAQAFYLQPMACVILVFLLYCGYFRYLKGTPIRGFRVLLGLLILCMLLFYVIRMGLYFPDRVPYVYQEPNVLSDWIPVYREKVLELIRAIRQLRG